MLDGTNIDPYWFPQNIPIPGVSKCLLQGVKTIKKKHIFDDFYDFYERKPENHLSIIKKIMKSKKSDRRLPSSVRRRRRRPSAAESSKGE